MSEKIIDLKEQRFGVEVEFYNITRSDAAKIVQSFVSDNEAAQPYHTHEHGLDTYKIRSDDGRTWKVVSDASVNSGRGENCELVTPILKYEDMPTLQGVIRALNGAGARSDVSCGIHIHIDGSNHDARSIRNLCLICASKEDIMLKALEVPPERYTRWCRKADQSFIDFLANNPHPTLNEIEREYYTEGYYSRSTHYHSNRYRLVNLHDYFNGHGTIEFRAFNGESKKHTKHLHAGEVKAYVDFCLAISAQAINNKHCRYHAFDHQNERYTYRTWLVGHQGLNLNGAEYKNTRLHLLGKLEGDATYKDRAAALEKRSKKLAEKQLSALRPQVDELMDRVMDMPPQQRDQLLQNLFGIVTSAESEDNNNNNNNGRGGGR